MEYDYKNEGKILVLEYNNKNGIKISYSIPHQLTGSETMEIALSSHHNREIIF